MMFVKTENKIIVDTFGVSCSGYYPGKTIEQAGGDIDYLRIVNTRSSAPIISSIDVAQYEKMIKMVQFPEIHAVPKEGFLFRQHRGSLISSMLTVEHFDNFEELKAHIRNINQFIYASDKITVEKYGTGIDERIGWNTHIVSTASYVVGFTSGPVP